MRWPPGLTSIADAIGIRSRLLRAPEIAELEPDGRPLPGVAQVAHPQGRYAAGVIAERLASAPAPPPFRYFDKGNMVIGRGSAVLGSGRLELSGLE